MKMKPNQSIPFRINIIQWNCKSATNKLPDLQILARNSDILILSETWLNSGSSFFISGFEIIRRDRMHGKGGGVAVCLKKGIKFTVVDDIYDCDGEIEVCAVTLYSLTLYSSLDQFTLVSCYRPPGGLSIVPTKWSRFFNQFTSKVLICGDINSHHIVWGSDKCCQHGENILEGLENSNLTVVNDGIPTYFDYSHKKELAIDLTISDHRTSFELEWYVDSDLHGTIFRFIPPWQNVLICINLSTVLPDYIQ